MKRITVIGETLVEIMADHPGHGFAEPIALTGPFPSGAPAIFAAQAARLGQPVALISCVGADDFGRLTLTRLAADGVDISAVATHPDLPTGTAFVRYRPDGARDFVFNIRHCASGAATLFPAALAVLDQTDHLHIMGTALFSPSLLSANLAALDLVKARGGTVSFDPNLRPELLASPGLVAAKAHSGAVRCGPAQRGRTGPADRRAGRGGCRGRAFILRPQGDRAQARFQPGFPVPEVDPTGAGDCFGAAFISLWLRGTDPALALRLAAAAGALAVTRRGPMEGAGTLADLTARAAGAENFSPKNFVSPPDRSTSVCQRHCRSDRFRRPGPKIFRRKILDRRRRNVKFW